MCQQYEAEREFVVRGELMDIKKKWEAYKRGEIELTEEEVYDLAVQKFMLEEN